VYFQKSVEIPSLPRTQSRVVHEKVPKFDALKEALLKARSSADNELNNFEKLTNELKEEISENNNRINKYMSEILNLKSDSHNKNNEIYNLTKKLDIFNDNFVLLEEENKKLHNNLQQVGNKNIEFGNKITGVIHQIFQNFKTTKYQKYAELINYQSYSENRVINIKRTLINILYIIFYLE